MLVGGSRSTFRNSIEANCATKLVARAKLQYGRKLPTVEIGARNDFCPKEAMSMLGFKALKEG